MGIPIDWHTMWAPTMSLVELFLRMSIVYLFIIVAMRVLRRQKGALNAADLVVLVVVADAAQNAMSSEYKSVTEGIVLIVTLFFWNYVLDMLSYRFDFVDRMLNPKPVHLIRDGQFDKRAMRQQMLREDDVLEQLREQGVDDVKRVKRCCLEGDGHFSVIKVDDADTDARPIHTAGAS